MRLKHAPEKKLTAAERDELKLACQKYGFSNPEKLAADHDANPGPFTSARTLLNLWFRMK